MLERGRATCGSRSTRACNCAVAAILERAAPASGAGKGAVVVVDAGTGELLASVSYPWPSGRDCRYPAMTDVPRSRALRPVSAGIDVQARSPPPRRCGRIRPLSSRTFVCQRLPADRIGARIPGFGRPIRDDVRDRQPHGTIAMHDAIVRSCNAYFAQLAVALGSEAAGANGGDRRHRVEPSTLAGTRARQSAACRLRTGRGAGHAAAAWPESPRPSARTASIREPPIVSRRGRRSKPFLSAGGRAARWRAICATRSLSGTGRRLSDHPARIAGKTGTAEVDEAASHAWFVGFAPHGPAGRRIAFAVMLENAGYGGVAAASVAGQVATAATSLGYMK